MKIVVSNVYTDDHQCERSAEIDEPEELNDDWWLDEAYVHTGCGTDHSETKRKCDSHSRIEITEADNPDFVGEYFEYW